MPKAQTLRIASGSPDCSFSGVWRVVADRDDVFLGASKAAMGIFKISLHRSGVWVLAGTSQSGATFEGGNRRAKQWTRPLEHVQGVTRGPSILVPHTSLGPRKLMPGDAEKRVHWYRAPKNGEVVEFSLYFVHADPRTSWGPNETEIGSLTLRGGNRVIVLASVSAAPQAYLDTVERILRENVFRTTDMGAVQGGSFLWVTESQDRYRVPIISDLPVPLREQPREQGAA